jgi:hypothetical protein
MHIVRSDEQGDTSVVSITEMRTELESVAVRYDPEVQAVENAAILLFAFQGDPNTDEIAIVANGITWTIRESPALFYTTLGGRIGRCNACDRTDWVSNLNHYGCCNPDCTNHRRA